MSTGTLERLLPREKLRGAPTAIQTSYPSGTLWPHGEWSYGFGKELPNPQDWHEDPFVGKGVLDTEAAREEAQASLPLNLSDAANSCKWPRRGTKGISGFGQQMIKAAGHLIQKRWPHHRKTLGTITLPPMPDDCRRQVVEDWPVLTNQLLTWLSRRLKRQGLPQVVLSVTEIQPERLAATGEGSLHWHLLWLNHPGKKGNWAVDPCDVRAWLGRVLRRRIKGYTGGHINVNTKPVEGVVAAYMAKYMSKGKQLVSEAMSDWGHGLCPRTWWNMTKDCRAMVKAATLTGRAVGAVLDDTLQKARLFGVDECYAFLRPVLVTMGECEYVAGWRGRFLPELEQAVRGMLESHDIVRFEGLSGCHP